MNEAMRMLYRGGFWLPSADASCIARCGLLHLRAYRRCADLSVACREPRFPIHCKAHMGLCENRAFFKSYLETLSFFFLPYRFTLVQHPLHQTLSFSVLARLMVELS